MSVRLTPPLPPASRKLDPVICNSTFEVLPWYPIAPKRPFEAPDAVSYSRSDPTTLILPAELPTSMMEAEFAPEAISAELLTWSVEPTMVVDPASPTYRSALMLAGAMPPSYSACRCDPQIVTLPGEVLGALTSTAASVATTPSSDEERAARMSDEKMCHAA